MTIYDFIILFFWITTGIILAPIAVHFLEIDYDGEAALAGFVTVLCIVLAPFLLCIILLGVILKYIGRLSIKISKKVNRFL